MKELLWGALLGALAYEVVRLMSNREQIQQALESLEARRRHYQAMLQKIVKDGNVYHVPAFTIHASSRLREESKHLDALIKEEKGEKRSKQT